METAFRRGPFVPVSPSRCFITAWGAPNIDAAWPVAEEELTQMATLCEDQPENIMDHQALGYTENQIERIGRYFESMPEDEC